MVRTRTKTNLHVVEHFEEGKGHATHDQHLVDLVQQVLDKLNLVLDLSTPENSKEGPAHKMPIKLYQTFTAWKVYENRSSCITALCWT